MKKTLFLLFVLSAFFTHKASAQYEGTFGGGAHLSYGKSFKTPGIGAYLQYNVTDKIRVSPAYTRYFSYKGRNLWAIDADAHYLVPLNPEFSLYPLAGLNFERFKFNPDVDKKHFSRIGANIGFGIQYDIKYHVTAHLETKYQMIKDFSQVIFMAGIGYWF